MPNTISVIMNYIYDYTKFDFFKWETVIMQLVFLYFEYIYCEVCNWI